jgi:hypothetical protein
MEDASEPVAGRTSADACLTSDLAFDALYERRIRELSPQHWTPVRIARRAAELLTLSGAKRILDVGSGVGKFCIVGALTTEAQFVGIEPARVPRRDLTRGRGSVRGWKSQFRPR